ALAAADPRRTAPRLPEGRGLGGPAAPVESGPAVRAWPRSAGLVARGGQRKPGHGRGGDTRVAAGHERVTTPPFSIVIETDNLALATLGDLRACLDSLAAQRPTLDTAAGVFLVDAGQVPEAVASTLGRDYPWLTLASARPETLYVGLKEAGAART